MSFDLDEEELKATRILHGVAKEEIEEIELREDDIQVITTFNVWVNCPKCGKEYYEPDVDYEKEYICECEECGHKFKFYTGSHISKGVNMDKEIEVGEYIRANGGYIGKVIEIREKESRDCDTYYVCDTVMASGFYEHIIKHSPNLIDIIEERRLCKWRNSNRNKRMGII